MLKFLSKMRVCVRVWLCLQLQLMIGLKNTSNWECKLDFGRSNLGGEVVQSVSSPSLSRTHCFNYTLVQHAAPLLLLFLLTRNKRLWAWEETWSASGTRTAGLCRRRKLPPYLHIHKQTGHTMRNKSKYIQQSTTSTEKTHTSTHLQRGTRL